MSSNAPKVAILGFHLESNAFSPLSVEADFLAQCWEQGEDITRLARGASRLPSEVPGFYARMDELGAWTPAPLIVIGAPPGGPASAGVWRRFLAEAETRLRAALPVDAVYVANHGASSAEGQDDTEGELMGRLRAIVGPGVPIVASHDLHCNVSEQTVQALDGLISYRTNPHVDQRERAADAADMIHEILGGTRMVSAYVRLPLTPPSVTLLTSSGPYADLVALGASLIQKPDEGPIANVSVCSGFVFSDLPKCGLTITVTARGDLQAARRAALRIARAGWADRKRYVANTVEVARAVELARAAGQPLLFADVADNPGGGGGGNTAWLLRAFHEARIPGVVLGVFVDPELAAQAAQLGEGAEFDAVFNRIETDYARRYQARARAQADRRRGHGAARHPARPQVLAGGVLPAGAGRLGHARGGGSLRRQLAEPAMLEMHGIDIARAGHVVVKSRGHYRAGFDEFFPDDRIHDVDSLGLTTPNLKQIAFKRLPRPVWPLDDAAAWQEPDWAEGL